MSKTNMEYFEESKKELEEDEKVNPKENSQVENIINDIDKFNLDSSDDNKINIINSNNNIHQEDENYINLKKNNSQIHNPNSKMKNNNTNQDFPSPLFDQILFNQQNNAPPKSPENINSFPQINPIPNINPAIQINPMNQLYGMNPGFSPYPDIPKFGNMMQIPMHYNINNINQYNNNINIKIQKNNDINKYPENIENPNKMNMYPNQFGELSPPVNPMMNNEFSPNNFQNAPNYESIPTIARYIKGGIIESESSIPIQVKVPFNISLNFNFNGDSSNNQQPNMNIEINNENPNNNYINNNLNNNKEQNKENFEKKDLENISEDDIIEKAVAFSKYNIGSLIIQKKCKDSPDVKNKIFEKI